MPAIPSCKDKILKTALVLFYKNGIKSTSVDMIINAAGVNKSTFFKWFPSKQELVNAYLAECDDIWLGWFKAKVMPIGSTPECKLLGMFDVLEEWLKNPEFRGCAFINAVAEAGNEETEELRYSIRHKARVHETIEGILESSDYEEKGVLADRLLLLIDGVIVRAQLQQDSRPATDGKEMAKLLLASHKKQAAGITK